jgi:hypothetical protein
MDGGEGVVDDAGGGGATAVVVCRARCRVFIFFGWGGGKAVGKRVAPSTRQPYQQTHCTTRMHIRVASSWAGEPQ